MEQMVHRPNDILQQKVAVVLPKAGMLTATVARPNVFPIGYDCITYSKTCSAKGRIFGECWSPDCLCGKCS